MPTKTISLELDAYEKLKSAKRFPRESFSEVVRRVQVPVAGICGRELLAREVFLDDGDFDAIDALNVNDAPPDIP
ncbi:MAG: antitoxin VapB family protein [Opitutales bacterium]